MSDQDTIKKIVSIRNAYGISTNATDALQKALPNLKKSDLKEEEVIEVVTVKGFQSMMMGRVEADEIIATEKLETKGDKLRKVIDLMSEAELTAEEVLVTADVITEEEK